MSSKEIVYLEKLLSDHDIQIKSSEVKLGHLKGAVLLVKNEQYTVYLEDEYEDFDDRNQVMCLFLCLLELGVYEDAEDYLSWCKVYGLDASTLSYLDYFKSLEIIYKDLHKLFGKIDCGINPLDYQLRSGAFAELIKK